MAVAVACDNKPAAENQGPEATTQTESIGQFVSYGAAIKPDNAVGLATAAETFKAQDTEELTTKMEGEIEATCAMKGCWMTLTDEVGETIRVTFKDYGFFVPTSGQEGKKAIVEGVLRKQVLSVEEQQHLAEDGGKSPEEIAAITETATVLSFEATGVLIENEEALN